MVNNKKRVAFHTIGCKLNFAETSAISRLLPEDRYEKVPANGRADIYVINTCSVTYTADKKCKQAIRKFIHMAPDALIAVAGCYAQLKPQDIASIPGVNLVLGTNEKFLLADYLEKLEKKSKAEIHSCNLSQDDQFKSSYSVGGRTRSFLKIQDGCDYGCAYCTVPFARGKSRNPEIKTLTGEAAGIAEKGVREIVLTGVNIGDFGKSTGDSFYTLLKELVKVPGIERWRISSVEPNLLTDEIVEIASANRKILPHFHIPLQSGCNKILHRMGRRYKRELFSDRVRLIKEKIPAAGIGADVIVGFPGESQSDFEDSYEFIKGMPLSYLHVFTYSERPGTAGIKMSEKVSRAEKDKRSKILISLSEQKHLEFCKDNIGQVCTVLFEHSRHEDMVTGFTGNYLRVEHPWQKRLPGNIRKVKLTGISRTGKMSAVIID
jgi:threonylcarbamoyladenosine tRNA methylthiotransferase MtaB